MDYFKRKLDDKNRLTIPVELRAEFGGKVVLTRGFANYLHLYSETVWNEQMRSALSGSWKGEGAKPAVLDEELADMSDQFLDGMTTGKLDSKQGRVVIEPELARFAGFEKSGEVVATRMPAGNGASYWRLRKPKA
jgi:MraZ protein